MNTSDQFNKNENNNSENLKSRNDYPTNFIGANKNKIDVQKEPKSENDLKAKKHKKKIKKATNIFTAFATMVSAVFIIGAVGNILPTKDSIVARIESVFATETEINYSIALEEYDGSGDVYVVLYNDFTNRKEIIPESYYRGFFQDLQPYMTYTLAVKHGSKTLASTKVKTVIKGQSDGTNGP